MRKNEWNSRARSLSIYIGGGTPSTLPPHLLQKVLSVATDLFSPKEGAEITIEANPDDITKEWISAIQKTPINRISMGVQTFNDTLLQTLRRRHNGIQAHKAVRLLQDAGYSNISIDLIYSLPGQTLEMWERDIEEAISLNIPHLSAYSLMYEEGTPITRMLEDGLIEEMSDEMSWRCYEMLCRRLKAKGYEHYEISNFALPNKFSRHNSGYWTGESYLGFGAGAHSYDGNRSRRGNMDSLEGYIEQLSLENPGTFFEIETLSDVDLYNEFIMTRLRTAKGFYMDELQQKFGPTAINHCIKNAETHLKEGNLQLNGRRLSLTQKGVFVSNDVISELFV